MTDSSLQSHVCLLKSSTHQHVNNNKQRARHVSQQQTPKPSLLFRAEDCHCPRLHALSSNKGLPCRAGWRRLQSIPVYATEDANGRHRMLKYTPEHMHCLATIYGANAPPNTGVLAIQTSTANQQVRHISLEEECLTSASCCHHFVAINDSRTCIA